MPTGASDESRKWVVLGAAFVNLLVNGSVAYNVGVVNLAVLDTYHGDVIMTSWLMAMYASMFALASPISSAVINLTSCRTCVVVSGVLNLLGHVLSSLVTQPAMLFITLFIAGVGQAMSLSGGSLILTYYFTTMSSIANGIFLVASGLGSFVHPFLAQFFIDVYGLKGAFLILGAISFNSTAVGLLMKPNHLELSRKEEQKLSMKKRIMSQLEIAKNAAFTYYLLSLFTQAMSFMISVIYLPEYLVKQAGYGKQEASLAASVIGVGALCSRVLTSFAATEPQIGEMLMYIGMNACSFLLCMLAPYLLASTPGVYIFTFSIGVYAGGVPVLFNPINVSILGLQRAATGFGLVFLSYGIGTLASSPIAALIVARFGYDALFVISGITGLMSSAFAVLSALSQKKSLQTDDIMKASQKELQCSHCRLPGLDHEKIIMPEFQAQTGQDLEMMITKGGQTSDRLFTKNLADDRSGEPLLDVDIT